MKIYIDSSDIKGIKEINKTQLVDGITTNPSLIAKQNKDIKVILKEICKEIKGPVSAEVTATQAKQMIEEAKVLQKISKNIVIKLPLTFEGLKACSHLTKKGYKTNVTLCFSVTQALLAAKAGATYISPFVGRLDDIGPRSSAALDTASFRYLRAGSLDKNFFLIALPSFAPLPIILPVFSSPEPYKNP